MRKVIRKRIRRSASGVNIAADIDAVIAINTGEDAKTSRTVVHSSHNVVQGTAADEPDRSPPDPNDPKERADA